ncbi:MAG: hypothetical protein NTV86_04170 [Planctomycetota bacterium]|nr:hypothetical protein [Planctomycetota bacterium]
MANFQVERLRQLPQRAGETWQGGFIRLPSWIKGEGDKPYRAVIALWGSLKSGKVGSGKDALPKEEVNFAMAVNALVDFAAGQYAGYRPGKLEVNDPALAEHLSGLLADQNIRVEHRPKLLMIDRCVEDLTRSMCQDMPVPPGYLQGKGVTPPRVRAFAEAAQLFYEAAPWQHLANEDLIEIESPRPDVALRFAVVLGCGGREYGLGFYRSQDHYWSSRDGDDPRENFLASGGVWSLTFDDITSIPFGDADLWEDENLPVAGEEAYPIAIHFEPPMRMHRPGADTLAFFEGLMRALAATTEDEMDAGRWTKTAATANGPMEFVLSLPFLLKPLDHKELYNHGLMDRRSMDAMHAQMDRFLEGRAFANADEMNEAINKEFGGKVPDAAKYKPRTPLEEAQDLCYQAFDAIGRRRIVLARKAIQTCPDCADAYVILAENAPTLPKAGELYAAGVQAGRRALGEPFFQENAGHFWGIAKTRPFMRALCGLAQVQDKTRQVDEAISNYQELLRLNPNDNQGVRYILLPLLLTRGQWEPAEKLIKDFPGDVMATWRYSRALLAFGKKGDTPAARKHLKAAIAANRYVPAYLLGDEEIDDGPDKYSIGSPEEAGFCASECVCAWQAIPGALDWLSAQSKEILPGLGRPNAPGKK